MKKINVLFIALLFLGSISQAQNSDYSILRTDVVSYFSKNESGSSPKAIRIDQSIPTDSGTIYRSYEMGAFVYFEGSWTPSYIGPHSSFIGNQALVKENGTVDIYNAIGKVLHFEGFGYSGRWEFYNEGNGARIEAEYVQPVYQEILEGLYDSCAVINLYVYDTLGNIMNDHFLSNFQFNISKRYGLTKLFEFNQFRTLYLNDDDPSFSYFYHLTGIDKTNEQFGYNFNFYEDLVKSIEIGTEIQYSSEENSSVTSGIFEIIRRVTDKIVDDSTCTYVYKVYKRETHHVNYDSTIEYQTYSYKMMPSQTLGKGDSINWSGVYSIGTYTEANTDSRAFLNYSRWYFYRNCTWCTFPTWNILNELASSQGTSGYYRFIEGLGEIAPNKGENAAGDIIVYYKTPSEEWGTPYDFFSGVHDVEAIAIEVYPNPANDRVLVSFNNEKVNKLNIINLQGKTILTKEIQEKTKQINLEISNLKEGIYFIELILDDNRKYREKLIVN